MHEEGPCLRLPPPSPNVLVEMTDFMLICIYPALITLQEARSEHPAFNTMGWQVPTPACPCLLLLAGFGAGAAHTATAQGTGRGTSQGGTYHGTRHPCPSWGVPQRCCLGTGGHPRSAAGKQQPKVLHGWAWMVEHPVEVWARAAMPLRAMLCRAMQDHAHPPRLQQSGRCPAPAARLAHTAL